MKVSELARRAGVAPSAVRFYEETGVLPPAARGENGYRDYGDEALARLSLVVALRRLGLPPVEAGRLASLCIDRGEVDIDLEPLIARQRADAIMLGKETVFSPRPLDCIRLAREVLTHETRRFEQVYGTQRPV